MRSGLIIQFLRYDKRNKSAIKVRAFGHTVLLRFLARGVFEIQPRLSFPLGRWGEGCDEGSQRRKKKSGSPHTLRESLRGSSEEVYRMNIDGESLVTLFGEDSSEEPNH